MFTCSDHQAKNGIDRYLNDLIYSDVRSLDDIVRFNDEHSDIEFDKGKSSRIVHGYRKARDPTGR